VLSLHGVAMYDSEWQPYCFSTLLLSQIMGRLAADPQIETIVLDIDTPGGMVTGTQEAADAVFAARRKKRVIGLVNPLCASAGYWIASQCSEIVGVPSADIGSIGVFMCHYDCSAMLADAGIKPTYIFAGEYKTEGNSSEPLARKARPGTKARSIRPIPTSSPPWRAAAVSSRKPSSRNSARVAASRRRWRRRSA
jgi:ClpP class serine protease